MDRTVPSGAALLLDFVRKIEVGTEARAGYDIIYGFNQDKLERPITQLTVDEVLAQQGSFTSRFGSSATGGYQFMKATLGDLKRELGLSGTQVMDPDLQDRLAYHLLKRRGYDQFIDGLIDRTEFGKRLAMEWASFPVLAATKGAHRQLSRGQSYYAGDKLNKSLVSPEELEAVIDKALTVARVPQASEVPMPPIVPNHPATPEIGESGYPIYYPKPGEIIRPKPSPMDQISKVIGSTKGTLKGNTMTAAVMTLLVAAGWLPEPLRTPEAMVAMSVLLNTVATTLWGALDTYMAPKNAE